MPSEEFLGSIIERDLELIRADAINKPEYGDHASEPGIMADFTEYSPFTGATGTACWRPGDSDPTPSSWL